MSVKGLFFSVSILSILIAGCATGPSYLPAAPPNENEALVYFYRLKTPLHDPQCKLVPTKVEIGSTKIAILRENEYTWIRLEPGYHELSASWARGFVYFKHEKVKGSKILRGGETYYFRLEAISFSHNIIRLSIREIDPDTAGKELVRFRYTESSPIKK